MEFVISDPQSQEKAFKLHLYEDICSQYAEASQRIKILSNLIVNQPTFVLPVVRCWKDSILYEKSLNCHELLIFLINGLTANSTIGEIVDWTLILDKQKDNPLFVDFCCKLFTLCPYQSTVIHDLDLLYDMAHYQEIATLILWDSILIHLEFSTKLIDLLDLIVIEYSIKSLGLLTFCIYLLKSIHHPPTKLNGPTRVVSDIEKKKPMLLNVLSALLDLELLNMLDPTIGFTLVPILLECCQYDKNIAFTREPAIFSISRLVKLPIYNEFIQKMKLQSIDPSTKEYLGKIGYSTSEKDGHLMINKLN